MINKITITNLSGGRGVRVGGAGSIGDGSGCCSEGLHVATHRGGHSNRSLDNGGGITLHDGSGIGLHNGSGHGNGTLDNRRGSNRLNDRGGGNSLNDGGSYGLDDGTHNLLNLEFSLERYFDEDIFVVI